MNLSLAPEIEAMIAKRVQSGRYVTPEAVVAAALGSLENDEAMGDFRPGEWDALLAAGEQSGPPLDGQSVLAELRARRREAASR